MPEKHAVCHTELTYPATARFVISSAVRLMGLLYSAREDAPSSRSRRISVPQAEERRNSSKSLGSTGSGAGRYPSQSLSAQKHWHGVDNCGGLLRASS